MGTGRITDFTKPNQGREEIKRVQQNSQRRGVEVMDKTRGGNAEPMQIRLHEEVIIEGQNNVRLKKDGTPDLRFRHSPTQAEWEKIKRGEEQ